MPGSGNSLKNSYPALLISLAVIVADYFTKKAIVANLALHDAIDVLPFLRIVHYENKGAAFGMFADLGNTTFMIIASIAIGFIFLYLIQIRNKAEYYALSLILGGAVGNLIDRIRLGKVVDFIDVYVDKWHWPAFNVADSALTVGICIYLIVNIRSMKSQPDRSVL